jgi:tetratricopeptide (TPR) repeat protein
LVNRGNIYDEIHQPDRALEDYNRAIAINARDESAYYNRAVTDERLGRLDDAMNDYRRSCNLGEKRGCEALGRVLMREQQEGKLSFTH